MKRMRFLQLTIYIAALLAPPSMKAQAEGGAPIELRLAKEDAVKLAVDQHFSVKAAQAGKDITERNLVVEQAVFDPYLTLGATYGKNRRPTASFLDIGSAGLEPGISANPTRNSTIFGTIGGRTTIGTQYALTLYDSMYDRPLAYGSIYGLNPQDEMTASLEVTQPLLKGAWYPYNSARMRIASNNKRLAAHELEQVVTDLAYEVESTYWLLSFARKNHQAKLKGLATAAENLEKITQAQAAGTRSQVDVVTASSQLSLRKVELAEAQILLNNARDKLLLYLSDPKGESLLVRWKKGEAGTQFDLINVIPTSEASEDKYTPDRSRSIDLAFSHRSDYSQMKTIVENKTIELEVADNEKLPQLDLKAGWSQHGLGSDIGGAYDTLRGREYYSWSVGLELTVPLSSRGPRNRYLRVQDELRQINFQRAQLENDIVVEVDQVIRNLQLQHQMIQDLETRVRLQAQLLKTENDKLEAGRS
ncbi:MAG: TolC family protein, partial [Planctomycetota bacterium]|nr:TolC family protein [Planctomycetota bacterium]